MLRIGLLLRKIGCTGIFDDKDLTYKAATVLLLERSCILSVDGADEEFCARVGFGEIEAKRLNKPQKQMFFKLGLECKKKIVSFKICADYAKTIKPSNVLSVDHFRIGQYVDVIGKSIGKGFAGVIKRHNFSGLCASHGVSISHRSQGSTGQCQDPGRVFKGKKMAGHLGNARVTIQNLRVLDLDVDKQLLIVQGSVPGAKNSHVLLRDAVKKYCFG